MLSPLWREGRVERNSYFMVEGVGGGRDREILFSVLFCLDPQPKEGAIYFRWVFCLS